MTNDERFAELWTNYLEGELDEPGVAELRALLVDDERWLKIAADTYQTHRLLGLLTSAKDPDQGDFVRETLARLPADRAEFTRLVMQQVGQVSEVGGDASSGPGTSRSPRRFPAGSGRWLTGAAAAALTVACLLALARRRHERPVVQDDRRPAVGATAKGGARLASSAGARFFGELSPPLQSTLAARRDYVLMNGLVELAFPGGASAIVEGPAVFRVLSDECLALDAGRCSVHAPRGAEGFRVETPVTRVVDRGTRFTVSVAESSETEVQVIEGAADVYGRPETVAAPWVPDRAAGGPGRADALKVPRQPTWEVHLTRSEARRFWGSGEDETAPARFRPSDCRRGLPDRVVSYEATTAADRNAENLTSLTVQRGGEIIRYPVDRLIPVELTWFRSAGVPNPHGHIAAGPALPPRRGDVLSDLALNTGVINPGGSVRPLEADPILDDSDPARPGTPGFAVRFRRPVVNRQGPDVVLFELQTALNPPDGDAFHVSPLTFRRGRRSHTVRSYDLTMMSSEALKLTGFFLYRFPGPVDSLAALESDSCVRLPRKTNFHALAVGIDLSDLGFREGEGADGLFFQDAQDDEHQVDPVLIAGLPEAGPGKVKPTSVENRPPGPQGRETGAVPGGH